MLNMSHITSKIRIVAMFVIFDVQIIFVPRDYTYAPDLRVQQMSLILLQ
jgi:hypothetical protein